MDTMKHDEDEPAPNDHDWADRVCVLLHVGGDGTVQYSTVQYSTPRTPLEIRWRSVWYNGAVGVSHRGCPTRVRRCWEWWMRGFV